MVKHPVPQPVLDRPTPELEALTLQEKPRAGDSPDGDVSSSPSSSPARYPSSEHASVKQSLHVSPWSTGSLVAEADNEDGSWMTYYDLSIIRTWMGDPKAETSLSPWDGPILKGATTCAPRRPMVNRLPKGTRILNFVGEGTANAVFGIAAPPDSSGRDSLAGKLLRVAKVAHQGQAPTYKYTLQQDYYYKVIKPILGEYPVHQELVTLHNSGIIDELNALLQRIDRSRKPRFQGSFIGHTNWGFLVEDMRPAPDDGQILVEFKPKWLLQSPSAPAKAIRCRQCALEFRKFMLNPASKPCPENKPCPLALGNPGAPRQVRSPFRIANQLPGIAMADKHFEAALAKIMDHDVIRLLRSEQERLDQKGPLHATAEDRDLPLAMTIRDCTLFALIPVNNSHGSANDNAPIKVRLCDFDWKDPQTKAEKWSATERALIEEGFYTSDWILLRNDVDTFYHPPTLCTLEWQKPHKLSGLQRGLDIMVIERESRDSSTDGRSVKNVETKLPLGDDSRLTIHSRAVDAANIETLQNSLRGFKKEPKGTPKEATYNPLRPFHV